MDFLKKLNYWKNSTSLISNKIHSLKIKCAYQHEIANLSQIRQVLRKGIDSSKLSSTQTANLPLKKAKIHLRRVKKQKNNNLTGPESRASAILYGPWRVHCKSPNLSFKITKPNSTIHLNNSSMTVQKIKYSRCHNPIKSSQSITKSYRNRNSSYSSYSEVFKGFMEKLHLKN